MRFNCAKCGSDLGSFLRYGSEVRDVDGKKVGLFCKDRCSLEVENDLKTKRFYETYNGCDIYQHEEKFVTGWGAPYYFLTIEDARNRIDQSHVAIVSYEALIAVARGTL